jgi:hypothetical protein
MPTMLAVLCVLAPCLAGEGVHLPGPGLTLVLPELDGLSRNDRPIGDLVALWSGRLGESEVQIQVASLDRAQYEVTEPEDVLALVEGYHVERCAQIGFGMALGRRDAVEGDFGHVPYAASVTADLRRSTAIDGRLWLLGGITESRAWAVAVEALPLPDAEGARAIEDFLASGVSCAGEPRDWRWSDQEAKALWQRFAPPDARDKLEKIVRTEHYLILTNSSSGKTFGEKMEECYAAIQAIFPFPEVEGRRLMPVFLFRTPDQYHAYFVARAGITREQAERSKGHAWLDYYATWYEAPRDPVHIHEATHQIFANRLVLGGGGSWFQEGVAEYVETRANERNDAARLVKKQRHTPLAEFVVIESLLMSAEEDIKGGNEAGDHYKQAALLIEFLRESDFGKKRFQDFVHAVGRVPRNDLPAIEAAVRQSYGCALAELEALWVEYCKKR